MLSESSIVQSESFRMKKPPLVASSHTADKYWVVTIPFTLLTDQGVIMFNAIPAILDLWDHVGPGPINAIVP